MLHEIFAGSGIVILGTLEAVFHGSDAWEPEAERPYGIRLLAFAYETHMTHAFACKGKLTTYRKC